MLVSQTTEYALRAAVILAREAGRWLTNQQIAEASRVPAGYLAKVLQALARAQIVASQRGLGGGFTLARTPEEVSILDIVNAVDPIQRIRRCPLNLPEHRDALCPVHQALDDAMAVVEASFGARTLQDLLSAAGGGGLCSVRNGGCDHCPSNGRTACAEGAQRRERPAPVEVAEADARVVYPAATS